MGFIHKLISCIISELGNELVLYHGCPYKLEHLPQQAALGGMGRALGGSPVAPSKAALTFQVAVFLRK